MNKRPRWIRKGSPTNEYRPWLDHRYTLEEDGHYVWVGEPYGISNRDIIELAYLIGEGWDVHITAEEAVHYPGHTVAIKLTRDDA